MRKVAGVVICYSSDMTQTHDSEELRKIMPADIFEAHAHSINNRGEIEGSKMCGCFFCLNIFEKTAINEWVKTANGDEMAMCPFCGIDSVLADTSGYTISNVFLEEMNIHWFDGDHPNIGPVAKS